MLDFLYELWTRASKETGKLIGDSTVFNYFLKTMVFPNDRGIGKYVAKEDWGQKKDWPVNVDKRNKNKKYATYTEQEVGAMIQVADRVEEAHTADGDRVVRGIRRKGWRQLCPLQVCKSPKIHSSGRIEKGRLSSGET